MNILLRSHSFKIITPVVLVNGCYLQTSYTVSPAFNWVVHAGYYIRYNFIMNYQTYKGYATLNHCYYFTKVKDSFIKYLLTFTTLFTI